VAAIHYEVIVVVRDDLVDAWEAYLPGHVEDVLATGCFEYGEIDRAGAGQYRCRYRASEESLERYLREHAPRLRADATARFPEGIETARVVWKRWQRLEP
jgi:hypothetical protein